MGGVDANGIYLNDIWKTPDGYNWTKLLTNADWRARSGLAVVSMNNLMYVIGGLGSNNQYPYEEYLNDVWMSEDGLTWTECVNKHNIDDLE